MLAKRMACDLAWDSALYAEFFKKMGEWTQAKEKMSKTIELMQGCKADGSVKKKYEEKLARR
jgi:hypothetical protein